MKKYNHPCLRSKKPCDWELLYNSAAAKLKAARAALQSAYDWNQADIEGFDDISPDMPMLKARRRLLKKALPKWATEKRKEINEQKV